MTDREGTSFLVVSAKALKKERIKNMVRNLRKMPYAQACVRDYADIGEDKRVLQSYWTDVIIVEDGYMECTGLYSMTTRKHISAFLLEYFPNITFGMVKAIAGTGKRLDVMTGEVID